VAPRCTSHNGYVLGRIDELVMQPIDRVAATRTRRAAVHLVRGIPGRPGGPSRAEALDVYQVTRVAGRRSSDASTSARCDRGAGNTFVPARCEAGAAAWTGVTRG
jgi:hypothetical protein